MKTKLIFIIFYPLIFFVCIWNGMGEYVIKSTNIQKSDSYIPDYKSGLIHGWDEFKNTHKRIYKKFDIL